MKSSVEGGNGVQGPLVKATLFLSSPLGLVIMLLAISSLGVMMRTLPYLVHDPFFEVGFDTGTYENVLRCYTSGPLELKPAYPSPGGPYGDLRTWADPAFFVLMSFSSSFAGGAVNELFRWYLPVLIPVIFVLMIHTVSKRYVGSTIGLLGALIFVVSYVQIESVNESYYKQIFAIFLLILALYMLDGYLETRETSRLALFSLFTSGVLFYHRPTFFVLAFVMLLLLVLLAILKETIKLRNVTISLLAVGAITSLVWVPNFDMFVNLFFGALETSFWRVSTLPTGEGVWEGGGSILELFRGFDHVMIGYLLSICFMLPFTVYGFKRMGESRKPFMIAIAALFLAFYISIWLTFGNRFVVLLDILIIVITIIGFAYLIKVSFKGDVRRKKTVLIAFLIILLIYTVVVVQFQANKAPYIVDNIEGVTWMEQNVDKKNSMIFAPDYLSADIIQLGYRLAVWDAYLGEPGYETTLAAENFMINAPGNTTFVDEYLSIHPELHSMELYVLWGTWDLDRPLVETREMIPFEKYENCTNFALSYDGYSEILKIYHHVG
jgi:hypothetical protein